MSTKDLICVLVTVLSAAGCAGAVTFNVAVDHDATISAINPETNYGNDDELHIFHGDGTTTEESVLKAFGLQSLLSGYTGDDVVSAKLWVYQKSAPSNSGGIIYSVDQLWNEATIIWNNLLYVNGGAFGSSQIYIDTPLQGWQAIDVTIPVKVWLNGIDNDGFIIRTWSNSMEKHWYSSENTDSDTFSPFGNRGPFFEITVGGAGNVPMLSTNPQTDAEGNTWAVYGIDDSGLEASYQSFSNYKLMEYFIESVREYWLAPTNRATHPSYGQGETQNLSSNWSDYDGTPDPNFAAVLGAMTFTPAAAGVYQLSEFITGSDWDEYNGRDETVLTFGKFDAANNWSLIYSVQVAHNAWFAASLVPELQNIHLGTNEKLAVVVTSNGLATCGVANLSRLKIQRADISNCDDVVEYGFNMAADFNHDCKIDYKDLRILANNWLN